VPSTISHDKTFFVAFRAKGESRCGRGTAKGSKKIEPAFSSAKPLKFLKVAPQKRNYVWFNLAKTAAYLV
jgi:hypothetical protein